MSRVTISLEPNLARQLDRLVRESGYTNRSAAVREMIRFGLDRADLRQATAIEAGRGCVAHVSFRCEPTVATRLSQLLHEKKALVKSSSRVPLDDNHFLEVVVLAGIASDVKTCAARILDLKGVNSGSVRMIAVEHACSRPAVSTSEPAY